MSVIWLNGIVGAGKTAVGRALAACLSQATFMDGDDHAGPRYLPDPARWRFALDALLLATARRAPGATLIIAYPLDRTGYQRLRTTCARAHRRLTVVTLATPLPIVLRGRGGRVLAAAEQARARVMQSKGSYRRRFAGARLQNVARLKRTARRIARLAAG